MPDLTLSRSEGNLKYLRDLEAVRQITNPTAGNNLVKQSKYTHPGPVPGL